MNNHSVIHEVIYKMETLYVDYCDLVQSKRCMDRALKNKKIDKDYYNIQVNKLKEKEISIETKFDAAFKHMYTNNELYNIKLSYILRLMKTYPQNFRQWMSLLCSEINKGNAYFHLCIL